MNDKVLEAKIVAAVSKAMRTYCEKWVTAEVLCEHVGCFTPRWLKDHGQMLGRTRAEWVDKDGIEHKMTYIYPLHRILEMVEDGTIKELKES